MKIYSVKPPFSVDGDGSRIEIKVETIDDTKCIKFRDQCYPILEIVNNNSKLELKNGTKTLKFSIEKMILGTNKSFNSSTNTGMSRKDLVQHLGTDVTKKSFRTLSNSNLTKEDKQEMNQIKLSVYKNHRQNYSDKTEMKNYLPVYSVVEPNGTVCLWKLAPKEVLEYLSTDAKNLMNMSILQISELNSYETFHKSVYELVELHHKSQNKMELCLLLEYMLRFYQLNIKQIRSKDPLPGCPNAVLHHILSTFTSGVIDNDRCVVSFDKNQKEKLFQAILVMFGYMFNYDIQLNTLIEDIKCSVERIKKLLQPVKMSVKSKNETKEAQRIFRASTNNHFMVIDEP